MLKGFKDFLMGGELVNIAVGLVMALATFTLIESVVNVLVMPFIADILGDGPFETLSVSIGPDIQYGYLISAAITFLATATAVYYLVVVPYGRYGERQGLGRPTRSCPECTTSISAAASRCPACTAQISPLAG